MDLNQKKKDLYPNKNSIVPKALWVLKKYENSELTKINGKLLPKLSNQKMNTYLKEIGELCKIKKNLTSHVAKHTFATTVTLSNGVPIETVSKLLGNTKMATTQIYARVLEKKEGEDMNLLRAKFLRDVKK